MPFPTEIGTGVRDRYARNGHPSPVRYFVTNSRLALRRSRAYPWYRAARASVHRRPPRANGLNEANQPGVVDFDGGSCQIRSGTVTSGPERRTVCPLSVSIRTSSSATVGLSGDILSAAAVVSILGDRLKGYPPLACPSKVTAHPPFAEGRCRHRVGVSAGSRGRVSSPNHSDGGSSAVLIGDRPGRGRSVSRPGTGCSSRCPSSRSARGSSRANPHGTPRTSGSRRTALA